MLQQRHIGAGGGELGFGLGDVFRARTDLRQAQGLLAVFQLGLGDLLLRGGAVDVLLAHGTAARAAGADILQAAQLCVGEVELGAGGLVLGLGAVDILGARAVLQTQQVLFLGGDLRLGLVDLQAQGAGIKAGQHVAGFHRVAFLDIHLRDALAAGEGQRHLADVHVAVEHQAFVVTRARVQVPPHSAPQQQRHERHQHQLLRHSGLPCFVTAR